MTQIKRPRTGVTFLAECGWYLSTGTALVAGYFLLALVPGSGLLRLVAYATVVLSVPVAVTIGVRRHGCHRPLRWYLAAAGQGTYGIGDVIFYLHRFVVDVDTDLASSLCYLLSYPLMAAGLLGFIRRRAAGRDVASLIDTAIVGLGAGLVMWVYLLAPGLADATRSSAVKTTVLASAVMDLVLGILAIRLALGDIRVVPAYRLLLLWIGGLVTADLTYGYLQLTGGYRAGDVLDLLWLASALALGAAALHPSMRSLDRSPAAPEQPISTGRLAALALTCLTAPALLYLEYLQRAPLHVPLIAAASAGLFLLALARMKVIADGQRRAAITDPLTGLRTRRFLREAMHRHAGPDTWLLLLDLDHFKEINDRYGHTAGDDVLREVSQRLLAARRRGDVVARYGGEEFAILLPKTTVVEIAAMAEQIRQSVAGAPIATTGHSLRVTASIGGATWDDGHSLDELIAEADHALYAAKRAGRNRVMIAPNPAPRPPTTPAEALKDRPAA
ncbi:hypothetical protein ACWT_3281 [Actinoplanes sp. SE50]|uniref:GGDEF domain-containing protein n=1 Tax=unclassified Actinoplanes TaxID=2626549 RepID=UPI00023ECCA9|nr:MULTISPECIES: GGDEF domain-containing protein [unclassified Actinoplanes]AEV84304.1 putative membrane protein [Actinoplanes sp. SE50/110]ATO82696.1 hypothetical protein ACWT_3281 [Actinoplanes sp. SE50]SLM00103.1 hypothetical protein ACSP50_3335 [Actinoplanes sp. SE50/110]